MESPVQFFDPSEFSHVNTLPSSVGECKSRANNESKSSGGQERRLSNSSNGSIRKVRRRDSENEAAITADRSQMRRSSSAMRVRELREVLTRMTSAEDAADAEESKSKLIGSQSASLLVASQLRLMSRLQDIRQDMESMDNEVTRVKADIINNRRYVSDMMGIPCRIHWPPTRQADSAYTSLNSRDASLSYSSDDSFPPTANTSTSTSPSQALQHFEELAELGGGQSLSRTDSCSSFLSWRSDVELAGVFPEEADPVNVAAYQRRLRATAGDGGQGKD